MKTIKSLLTIIATTLLFGCATTPRHGDFSGMPATDITVTVSCGDPGMTFTGTIVSDGHSEQLSGAGSATFHATGHEFVCSFRKTGVAGRISISVSEAGESLGSSSTTDEFGGVRAELLRTPSRRHTIFTTF
jgi:hypothetical protein